MNLKTNNFNLIKLAADFYLQLSYLVGERPIFVIAYEQIDGLMTY
jgi:hypothetical protein